MGRTFYALVIGLLLLMGNAAQAAVVLDAGDHTLLPNQAGQTFAIMVIGEDQVAGLDLVVQVGDELSGLTITGADLNTGTIFDGGYEEQYAAFFDHQAAFSGLLAADAGTSSVLADGVAAFITVDTTGLTAGTYDILLEDVTFDAFPDPMGSSFLDASGGPVATTSLSGTLTIIPEPTAAALLFVTAAGAMVRRRRVAAHRVR